jgi:hypothetical protein
MDLELLDPGDDDELMVLLEALHDGDNPGGSDQNLAAGGFEATPRRRVWPPPPREEAAIDAMTEAARKSARLRASLCNGFASLDPASTGKDSAPAGRRGASGSWRSSWERQSAQPGRWSVHATGLLGAGQGTDQGLAQAAMRGP